MEFYFSSSFFLIFLYSKPLIAWRVRGWPWRVTVSEFSILFYSGWRVINFFWKKYERWKGFSFFLYLISSSSLMRFLSNDLKRVFQYSFFQTSIIIIIIILIIRNWPSANDYFNCKKKKKYIKYIYIFFSKRHKFKACKKKKKWLIMENGSTTKCRGGDIKRQYQSKIVFFFFFPLPGFPFPLLIARSNHNRPKRGIKTFYAFSLALKANRRPDKNFSDPIWFSGHGRIQFLTAARFIHVLKSI